MGVDVFKFGQIGQDKLHQQKNNQKQNIQFDSERNCKQETADQPNRAIFKRHINFSNDNIESSHLWLTIS